ncbi:uncharacterized protein LOC17879171 isoform X2 [Capsella rubella]|uniref:uncharacterized protein LOC17879171 isoform X2 n=1 Tax=Capsella rubella TaxID=81985 RepID=UPI000CD5AD5D|nr:uncharacterized protein LOC17879171 isoform X2 [Capsella rubella]
MCSYCQMSRVSKEAGDEDTTKFEDRTELVSPPLKKPKIDAEDAKAETEVVKSKMRILRKGNWKDPEYIRQEDLFEEQFVKSEGTNLKFVKYVSANVQGVQGFLFYITFWAQDVSSPNPEPKLY